MSTDATGAPPTRSSSTCCSSTASCAPATGGGTFATLDPATEEVLGVAADATSADMDAAVAAARRAFDTSPWATDLALRARCLRQLRDALIDHGEQLRELTTAEAGAPAVLTTGPQFDTPVEDLGYWADLVESYDGWRVDLGDRVSVGVPTHRQVWREPAGVVGAITPWNFPHQINLAKVGPALAAGCTVVLKAAPDTPWCASALGACRRRAHRPAAGGAQRGDLVGPRGSARNSPAIRASTSCRSPARPRPAVP